MLSTACAHRCCCRVVDSAAPLTVTAASPLAKSVAPLRGYGKTTTTLRCPARATGAGMFVGVDTFPLRRAASTASAPLSSFSSSSFLSSSTRMRARADPPEDDGRLFGRRRRILRRFFSSVSSFSSERDTEHSTAASTSSSRDGSDDDGKRPSTMMTDWRDVFRSIEYDDAWGPYVPLSSPGVEKERGVHGEGGGYEEENKSAAEFASDLLCGRWGGWGRKGLNLEPISVRVVAAVRPPTDYGDGDDNGKEEAGSEKAAAARNVGSDEEGRVDRGTDEDLGADDDDMIFQAQSYVRGLDVQTRFLIQMLDDLRGTGVRRHIDRPSGERCRRAIEMLEEGSYRLTRGTSSFTVVVEGLAARACAVLERMERCSPIGVDAVRAKKEEEAQQLKSSSPSHSTLASFPSHLSSMKHELPAPTRDAYSMALRLCAAEAEGKGNVEEEGRARPHLAFDVAQHAEDAMWSMIARGANSSALLRSDVDGGADSAASTAHPNSSILPELDLWNCVLRCWSVSSDPDRAFHAYAFLRVWSEWADQIEKQQDCDLSEVTTMTIAGKSVNSYASRIQQGQIDARKLKPDAKSYDLVLRACSFGDDQRSKDVGSGVAVRVFKDMERTSVAIASSDTYGRFFRAIGRSTESTSTSTTTAALSTIARAFRKCRDDGLVDRNVLNYVAEATTLPQLAKMLGKDDVSDLLAGGEGHKLSVGVLLDALPAAWTENARRSIITHGSNIH